MSKKRQRKHRDRRVQKKQNSIVCRLHAKNEKTFPPSPFSLAPISLPTPYRKHTCLHVIYLQVKTTWPQGPQSFANSIASWWLLSTLSDIRFHPVSFYFFFRRPSSYRDLSSFV